MFLPCLLILVLWVQLPHWLDTQGNALLHCPHSRSSLIELQTEAWKGFPVSCVRSSKQSCYPGNNLVFKTTSHIWKELYFLLWSIQEWKLWPPRRRGSVRTRVDPYKSFFVFKFRLGEGACTPVCGCPALPHFILFPWDNVSHSTWN